MKILVVTEKYNPNPTQRDGGTRLVNTLKQIFDSDLQIMQFGSQLDYSADWNFNYPVELNNRFENRIANANFIAKKVKEIEREFTHILFIHISMQFGLLELPLEKGIKIWTFPMFLTPSYLNSGEAIPKEYTEIERLSLINSFNIITPSHLEKKQLVEYYSVPLKQIHVIPRGITLGLFTPTVRLLNDPLKFCSVGSIKPQKNTLELIDLFANLLSRFPNCSLKIIGPIQDKEYYIKVCKKIHLLNLTHSIEFTGHIDPIKLDEVMNDCHLHISASLCETFGRSIFETLALGLPNVVRLKNNAAAEYLSHLPYARFVKNNQEAVIAIKEVLNNFTGLSSSAIEIGKLYDDAILSKLIAAKVYNKEAIAISDFDGTLFHKNDIGKTQRCMEAFQSFKTKVICSARSINDLLENIRLYNLKVDWIIGYSGAVVTDGNGKLLWINPLNSLEISQLKHLINFSQIIKFKDQIIQLALPLNLLSTLSGFSIEVYQNTAYISNRDSSKLKAIHRLLRYISWSGNVKAFGDGMYDNEFLTYFDGELIISSDTYNIKMNHLKKSDEIVAYYD